MWTICKENALDKKRATKKDLNKLHCCTVPFYNPLSPPFHNDKCYGTHMTIFVIFFNRNTKGTFFARHRLTFACCAFFVLASQYQVIRSTKC